MFSLLKVVLQVTFVICIVCGQEDHFENLCFTPKEEAGQCISLHNCDVLKPLIAKSRETLKQYHCGWAETVPKVCCPSTAIPTTSTTTVSPIPSDACETLEGNFGSCLPLQSCRNIIMMLTTQTAASLDYFTRSRCTGQGSGENFVCCDLSMLPSSGVLSRDGTCPPSAIPPNPDSQCCGIESYSGNKVFGGNETAIDQYPWLALLKYTRPHICGGSLISNKYVLTAAHCVLNKLNKPLGLVAVLLGEYNTANDGPDCVPVAGGGEDCTIGTLRVLVEEAIPHPEFNSQKIVQYAHDIALLRLSEMVTFNDFIKPICLPTSDITRVASVDMRFSVAGWGAVSETIPSSEIKLYTSLPYVDYEKCRSMYTRPQGPLIWQKQMCAGGEVHRDTCKGDSGGPLMYSYDQNKLHEIVGVVSFGLLQCGLKMPSVYTKVYDYLPWINSNIKP